MSDKRKFKETSNRRTYNIIHKSVHSFCDRCGWNRGCNRRRKKLPYRSWKNRKARHQWEINKKKKPE